MGKCRVDEDPPGGYGNYPILSLGENSMDRSPAYQYVTLEQLGEALKQVQEVVIKGVCEKMKAQERQPKAI